MTKLWASKHILEAKALRKQLLLQYNYKQVTIFPLFVATSSCGWNVLKSTENRNWVKSHFAIIYRIEVPQQMESPRISGRRCSQNITEQFCFFQIPTILVCFFPLRFAERLYNMMALHVLDNCLKVHHILCARWET